MSRAPVWIRPAADSGAPLVVFCHGMGMEPRSWVQLWPRVLSLPVHVLAPAGPYPFEIRKETGIRIGHAWYLYDGSQETFRETLLRSRDWLRETVLSLEHSEGWRPRHRALLGHSQGAYFGYAAALTSQDVFSHLVAAAGRLKEEFVDTALAAPGRLQILILHGRGDRAVPPRAAETSAQTLRRAGYPVALKRLPGGHRPGPEMDAAAADWLRSAWSEIPT